MKPSKHYTNIGPERMIRLLPPNNFTFNVGYGMYWTKSRYLFNNKDTKIVRIKDSIHEREIATFILKRIEK